MLVTPPVRAVLFDFGGTLDAEGVPWKERVRRHFADAGVAPPAERFDPVFYAADDALVGAIPTELSLADTVERLVGGVARALGVEDRALASAVAGRFLDAALERTRANAPLLARLARRYRLGIVSNFYGNLEQVCEDAGLRSSFGVVVDSARVGHAKPDPRIFRAALDALGVEAGAAVFVGDSLWRDMEGARDVGMRHVWLAPADAPAAAPCCAGDAVIHALRDVEALL